MSFAGFVPADDPQISIVVTVDEPNDGTTAGLVAAPVFSDIAQYALRILAVPPAAPTESATLIRGTAAPGPGDVVTAESTSEPVREAEVAE